MNMFTSTSFHLARLTLCITALVACTAPAGTGVVEEQGPEPSALEQPATTPNGTYCFQSVLNKDTTRVNVVINGSAISGSMLWRPFEKDGAMGTLSGTTNAAGEFDLLYNYMIEGQRQTETKIMKIEGGELWIKTGALEDPKNDGNLRFADASG